MKIKHSRYITDLIFIRLLMYKSATIQAYRSKNKQIDHNTIKNQKYNFRSTLSYTAHITNFLTYIRFLFPPFKFLIPSHPMSAMLWIHASIHRSTCCPSFPPPHIVYYLLYLPIQIHVDDDDDADISNRFEYCAPNTVLLGTAAATFDSKRSLISTEMPHRRRPRSIPI